eukprot:20763-Heterococcus_DN1.PRE.3
MVACFGTASTQGMSLKYKRSQSSTHTVYVAAITHVALSSSVVTACKQPLAHNERQHSMGAAETFKAKRLNSRLN